jgi:hypothetical protein
MSQLLTTPPQQVSSGTPWRFSTYQTKNPFKAFQVKGGPTSASLRPILEKIYSAAAEAEEKASAREGQNPRK